MSSVIFQGTMGSLSQKKGFVCVCVGGGGGSLLLTAFTPETDRWVIAGQKSKQQKSGLNSLNRFVFICGYVSVILLFIILLQPLEDILYYSSMKPHFSPPLISSRLHLSFHSGSTLPPSDPRWWNNVTPSDIRLQS